MITPAGITLLSCKKTEAFNLSFANISAFRIIIKQVAEGKEVHFAKPPAGKITPPLCATITKRIQ
jgi:hypothetical protein